VLARPGLPTKPLTKSLAPAQGQASLGAKLEQAKESTLANTLVAAPRQDLIHRACCATCAKRESQ